MGRGLESPGIALRKGDLCAEKGAESENQKKDQRKESPEEIREFMDETVRSSKTALVRLWKINKFK